MSSDVDRIKERIEIAEVIGSYVDLEKAGSNLKAKCPFHNEKTPSFFVSPDRGLYYCFGCGAKGDVFTFVQEFEGVDFYGALQILAKRAGITLQGADKEARDKRNRLFEILEMATLFFQQNRTENSSVGAYLKSRGISSETAESFRLGYAPDEWRALYSYLKRKEVSEAEMEESGLVKQNSKGRHYDRFRNRIIFPIADTAGRVVGFSGRLLDTNEKAPKYLNSPETDLFKKSSILYGYDRAKHAIRSNNFCILVEGQIDLVLAHQAGYKNTVAVSGTSITSYHLKIINRMTDNLLLAFDADAAGIESEKKAAKIALSMGMDVKAIDLPEDKDPADVITDDKEAWRELVRDADHIIEKHLSLYETKSDSRRTFLKQMRSGVLPLVAAISDSIDRSHFISVVKRETNIPESSIQEALQKIQAQGSEEQHRNVQHNPQNFNPDTASPPQTKVRKDAVLHKLKGIVKWQEEADSAVVDTATIQEKIRSIVGEDFDLDSIPEAAAFKAEIAYQDVDSLSSEVEELLLHLDAEHTREMYLSAMKKLKQYEKDGDSDAQKRLLKKCQQLSQHMHEIKDKIKSYRGTSG